MKLLIFLISFINIGFGKDLHFPERNNHIADQADILMPNVEEAIEKFLNEHDEATHNPVVVATVSTLEGVPIEDYALKLFRHWKLGYNDKRNGVLLLVAPKERKVRLEVGYDLEGIFTDAFIYNVINEGILEAKLPLFKNGKPVTDNNGYVKHTNETDWQGGIFSGALSIVSTLNGKLTVIENVRHPQQVEKDENTLKQLKSFCLFLLFFTFVFLTYKFRKFMYKKNI